MLILCYVGVPIRDLAGLAGVSAPPELWKVLTSSLPANSLALASNSSSTVITRFDFSLFLPNYLSYACLCCATKYIHV